MGSTESAMGLPTDVGADSNSFEPHPSMVYDMTALIGPRPIAVMPPLYS